MVNRRVDEYGTIRHYNEQDQLHREDGPAVEYSDGDKVWYINGKIHRINGPAEYFLGDKFWYINDLCHRIDGPAEEYANGEKCYYIMDKKYSYEQWLAIKDFPLLW